jgi:Domain of unknown function (DUF4249)
MKRIFAFLLLVAAASCIDPYTPNLKNYNSLLVVEGLITNENSSYKIKLSRTFSKANSVPESITDANVYIIDGDGIKTDLQNYNNGYYITDSTSFTGVTGQMYTLHILTSDGKEYKSDECALLPVAGIDNIHYVKGEEISGTQGELLTGLKILLNSTDATGMNQYFRWTFEEVWKFRIPYAEQYTYNLVNDTTFDFESVPVIESVCWKKNQSGNIITNSILPGGSNFINNQEIQFIAPVISDRLTQEYSILVKQYSISNNEYDFWNNLKKADETGGDIFASQPFTVISNIHNVKDASEMVLGYFEVSAVMQKRIFITPHNLDSLDLPFYKTDCIEVALSPADFNYNLTFDGIYHMYVALGYTFVGPEVTPGKILAGHVLLRDLLKLDFATKVCSICEQTGFTTKPDFWIDLE